MVSAQLITIGTEITAGEVVNTNASWLSLRLEEMGIRVFSHLSVRDHREEIIGVLKFAQHPLVFVTGGLGPTSDDITRECMAIFTGVPLDFDNSVWNSLKEVHEKRGLPLREAHRWQCHFPRGSKPLTNSVGTALGFYQEFKGRQYFVLPGPPRELEGMWSDQVKPHLEKGRVANSYKWVRWTCLGAPESEVAEKVEPLIAGSGIEIGYRAQVPYVKVKVYVSDEQLALVDAIEAAIKPWLVARGTEDLAELLLMEWPGSQFEVLDLLTGNYLFERLFAAKIAVEKRGEKSPGLLFSNFAGDSKPDFKIKASGDKFVVEVRLSEGFRSDQVTLPYKLPLNSERGRRSAAEWAIWTALSALRARESHS
jgi:nicotinamide-nucleotide amidase